MWFEGWFWSLIILGISVSFLLKIDVQCFLKNYCTSNQLKNPEVDSDSDEADPNDEDETSDDDDEPYSPLRSANKTLQGLHKKCSPPSSPPLKGFQD